MLDQTRELRVALGTNAEFVFLDGPFETNGESDLLVEKRYKDHKPFFEWWHLPVYDGSDAFGAEHTAKAITSVNGAKNPRYMPNEASGSTSRRCPAHDPYDVVPRAQQQKPWQLSICVGGMRVHGQNARSLFQTQEGEQLVVPMPSIHVIGARDPLNRKGHKLVQMYAPNASSDQRIRLVLDHNGGHRFPSAKQNPQAYHQIKRKISRYCLSSEPEALNARL